MTKHMFSLLWFLPQSRISRWISLQMHQTGRW